MKFKIINNKSVGEIIKVFEMVIARFGVPETVVCDNSPFNCWEFKKFLKEWTSHFHLSLYIIHNAMA